jgi:hypothetical protein
VEVPKVQDADETAHNLTKGIQLEQSSSCVLNANTHPFLLYHLSQRKYTDKMLLDTVCVYSLAYAGSTSGLLYAF